MTRALDEIIWAVNPSQDSIEDFALFISDFVRNYSRSAGLRSHLKVGDFPPYPPVSPGIRHHLYLATKEALHNIVKHAGATEIRFGSLH